MRRSLRLALAGGLILLFLLPVTVLADGETATAGVVVRVDGNVTIGPGETASAVVVVDGDATIQGSATSVLVVSGRLIVASGGRVDAVLAVSSTVELQAGATVTKDVRLVGSTVVQDPAATVGGTVSGLDLSIVAAVLVPFAFLAWIGGALALLLMGLIAAALGERQLRTAGRTMIADPVATLVGAIVAVLGVPILAVLLMITVLGIPAGIALVLFIWPVVWFLGYVVAGVRIGDWIVERMRGSVEPRPYIASVLGLLVLALVSWIPAVGFLFAAAGAGAVLVAAWRVVRGGTAPAPTTPAPAPTGPATALPPASAA